MSGPRVCSVVSAASGSAASPSMGLVVSEREGTARPSRGRDGGPPSRKIGLDGRMRPGSKAAVESSSSDAAFHAVDDGESGWMCGIAARRVQFGGVRARSACSAGDDVYEGICFCAPLADFRLERDVFGVDHGGTMASSWVWPDVPVHEEGLGDRRGVGEASVARSGIASNLPLRFTIGEDADQVAAHGCSRCSRCSSSKTSSSAPTTRSLSMPISLNSLTMTAYFFADAVR